MKPLDESTIAVIGLGYVGLPVAFEFSKKFNVIGFDISKDRIKELKEGVDKNNEIDSKELLTQKIIFSEDIQDIKKANIYIVTVPTPIDESLRPDLSLVEEASKIVAESLSQNDLVIFESTVYPGVTEEICGPLMEEISGLKMGKDFHLAYSPERINPGDKSHGLTQITKVVSALDEKTLDFVANLYASIIEAGVFKAKDIKTAEAAKVIENTQRDINIAFMNELSIIFDRLKIDTNDVLAAAKTKWNFLPFRPGLVGGHCIGVDPYYLTYKAKKEGHRPEVILSGRKINDNYPKFVASKLVKMIIQNGHDVSRSRVTILGVTFKENIPDIRNSKVFTIIEELKEYKIEVQLYDPVALASEVEQKTGCKLRPFEDLKPATAVIAAVGHDAFKTIDEHTLKKLLSTSNPIYLGISSHLPKEKIDSLAIANWFA